MIIPSQHASRVARAAAGGGGGDNTPAAVNWTTVRAYGLKPVVYIYSAQQITGIDTSITLQVVFSNTAYISLRYKIQSTSTVPASSSPPGLNGYSTALHNATITVSNNQYLVFGAQGSGTTTVTVNNTSDSNATLDTFTATSSAP